jgi:hypothetical protein
MAGRDNLPRFRSTEKSALDAIAATGVADPHHETWDRMLMARKPTAVPAQETRSKGRRRQRRGRENRRRRSDDGHGGSRGKEEKIRP